MTAIPAAVPSELRDTPTENRSRGSIAGSAKWSRIRSSRSCQSVTSPSSPSPVTSSTVSPIPRDPAAKHRPYDSSAVVQRASVTRSSGGGEATSRSQQPSTACRSSKVAARSARAAAAGVLSVRTAVGALT